MTRLDHHMNQFMPGVLFPVSMHMFLMCISWRRARTMFHLQKLCFIELWRFT